jgi:hypothetical protein
VFGNRHNIELWDVHDISLANIRRRDLNINKLEGNSFANLYVENM